MFKFLPKQWWSLTWSWLFKAKSIANSNGDGKIIRGHSIFAAILALSLGVGALSLTLAVVSGFEQSLGRKMERYLGTYLVNIGWQDSESFDRFSEQLGDEYEKVESIWRGQALLVGKKGGRGVVFESRRTIFDKATERKSVEDETSFIHISLGSALAEYLGVEEGDIIRALLPGITKKGLKAKISNIKNLGVYEIDSRSMIIDENSLVKFFNDHNIDALKKRPGDAYSLRAYLNPKIYDGVGDDTLFSNQNILQEKAEIFFPEANPQVLTWKTQHQNRLTTIEHDKSILSIILSILVVVAALNVAAALLVIYFERDREIILIRAIGMTPGQLKQWILLMGIFLGVVSSTLGIIGAVFSSWVLQKTQLIEIPEEIYNLSTLPIYFKPSEQIMVYLFGLFSSCLVAYFLGRKISKMPMVEVLGHRR